MLDKDAATYKNNQISQRVMRWTHLIVICLGGLGVIPLTAHAQKTPADSFSPPSSPATSASAAYPIPENFVKQPKPDQAYVNAALTYIRTHPRSVYNARVIMDLYMLGVARKNASLANQMLRLLVWNTPTGLYGSYVLSTFKSPQILHDYLLPYMDADRNDINTVFCQRMYMLLASALRMQGWAFMNDPGFLMKSTAIIDRVGNQKLADQCKARLKKLIKPNTPYAKLVEICFNQKMAAADRIKAIQKQSPGTPLGTYLQMVYLTALSKEEQRAPGILEIRVRHRIRQQRFSEALPLLDQLIRQDKQSQYRFWKGWCQAASGQTDNAQKTLTGIHRKPWGGAAQKLARLLRNMPTNLTQHGEFFMAMLEDLRTHFHGFEMVLQGTLPKNIPFELYLGVAGSRQVCMELKENGRVLAAYRSNAKTCRVFLLGHGRKYNTQGPIPTPDFSIIKDPATDRLFFQFGIAVKPYPQLDQAIARSLKSNWLTTPDGLTQLLVGMLKKGSFPAAAEQTPQGIRLKWLSPQLDHPQFKQRTFIVDDAGKLLSMIGGAVSITRLQFSSLATMQLDPPDMPHVPYVQADEANDTLRMAAFNRMLKTIMDAIHPQ